MKKVFLILFFTSVYTFSQGNNEAFKGGEYLEYKINYGLISAGYASLEIIDTLVQHQAMNHIVGKGWSTGMVHLFFPVEDDYQTYINKKTSLPHHFIRKINEGGYTKDKEIFFDFNNLDALIVDHKKGDEKTIQIKNDVQDLLSTLYHLRGLDLSNLKKEEILGVNMLLDDEIIEFKLVFKGKEVINTKFGKIKTLIFNPLVQEGRIFKENESVTVWISDDENKIPIKIKASVLVGSLRADLIKYKGLNNYFPIIFN